MVSPYENSVVIVRTQHGSIVGSHMIFTKKYRSNNPTQFDYKGYQYKQFTIKETVGGNVIVETVDQLDHSGAKVTNVIEFSNVTGLEILTDNTIKCGAIAQSSFGAANHTVVFDFDGVIHSYTSGWQGPTVIPDPPVPGIREVLKQLKLWGYNIVVSSSRCEDRESKDAVNDYLRDCDLLKYIDLITNKKPPALCYIDDRALTFDGKVDGLADKIKNFEPWHKEVK